MPEAPESHSRARIAAGRAHWRFRRATARFRLRPTFLIIGAPKAGTTSVHGYLRGHPSVLCAAPKEVRYFNWNYRRGEDWYLAQFPLPLFARAARLRHGVPPAIGEATPGYLFDPRAPERVHAFDPSLKLIVLVRDPIDRAYSQYQMHVRLGHETGTFEEALAREEDELPGQLTALTADPSDDTILINRVSYVAVGRYAELIERWLEHFPREQLLVVVTEDLAADPAAEMARIADFLGVPAYHATSYPRLHSGGSYAPLAPQTRERLAETFAEDNRRLERLLGRSLPWTTAVGATAAR